MFNPKSFKSISVQINVKNLTSEIILQDEKTLSTQTAAPIWVAEVFDRGLVLNIPKSLCAVGHHLEIQLKVKKDKKVIGCDATSKVTSVDPSSEGICLATLQLLQFENRDWEKILRLLEAEQDDLQNLMNKIKGEE